MSVKRGSLEDISDKKAFLISMLNEHPEGIVIYENTKGKDKQHAVLLTDYDYTNEKFYSADPDCNFSYYLRQAEFSVSSLPPDGQESGYLSLCECQEQGLPHDNPHGFSLVPYLPLPQSLIHLRLFS